MPTLAGSRERQCHDVSAAICAPFACDRSHANGRAEQVKPQQLPLDGLARPDPTVGAGDALQSST
ncbi:hypothetical protein ACFQPA_18345 [Halomarina halobia]|uniref:Uncharacterized protein n=1 Tax=Halomarina halobia TaxID=3033386 RepID=A0ABD6ADS3_9EURY|nr:hypothetical protein [Halomarina sp. PSR21]